MHRQYSSTTVWSSDIYYHEECMRNPHGQVYIRTDNYTLFWYQVVAFDNGKECVYKIAEYAMSVPKRQTIDNRMVVCDQIMRQNHSRINQTTFKSESPAIRQAKWLKSKHLKKLKNEYGLNGDLWMDLENLEAHITDMYNFMNKYSDDMD